jgi:TolA-binding protein
MDISVYAETSARQGYIHETHSGFSRNQDFQTIELMRQKIREQDERIDGLTTIIEGLSASIHHLEMKKVGNICKNTVSTDTNELLHKLAKMIDDINENYVSKEMLKKILHQNKKTIQKQSNTSENKVKIYTKGVRYFAKHHYDKAKKIFIETTKEGYKPAASNYYLGEISYYTKQYQDAIYYFKKSADLYENASYMGTLLLHTAISLEKIGKKKQAKVFYKNIIENYKGKKTEKIAKERMKKL